VVSTARPRRRRICPSVFLCWAQLTPPGRSGIGYTVVETLMRHGADAVIVGRDARASPSPLPRSRSRPASAVSLLPPTCARSTRSALLSTRLLRRLDVSTLLFVVSGLAVGEMGKMRLTHA
jgi:hypothetical protein